MLTCAQALKKFRGMMQSACATAAVGATGSASCAERRLQFGA